MLDDVSTWHCVGICFFSGSTCQQPLIRDLCEILFLIPAKPVPDVGGWGTVGMAEGRPGRSWPAACACHSRESGNLEARAVRQERGTRVGVGGCFVERRKDLGFPLKTAGMTEGSGNGREGPAGMAEGRAGRSWLAARACHSRESGNLEARAWRQERGTRVGVGGCFVERRKDLGFPLKTAGMTEGNAGMTEGSVDDRRGRG